MLVKHTPQDCKQAMNAIKSLVEQIKRIEDVDMKKHVCDSAIDLCNKLLREPSK